MCLHPFSLIPPPPRHQTTSTFQRYALVLLALQLFLLLNTCLLICYNPRDSLADLLAKTGILVHHPLPSYDPDDDSPTHHPRRPPRSRFSPRQEHGGVASPTAYRSEQQPPPQTYPVNGGGGSSNSRHQSAQRRASPQPATAVAVAYPLAVDSPAQHPHSMV